MARKPRIEFEGACYHVMARGNERKRIFFEKEDYQLFLVTLREGVIGYGLRLHAWCLMPNHYHLALETPLGNLTRAMSWIQTTFTARYNRIHQRVGHLFQGRYRAELVDTDSYATKLVAYLHLNPVRGRRSGRPHYVGGWNELQAYSWSSHPAWMGQDNVIPELSLDWLAKWGRTAAEARREYALHLCREMEQSEVFDWKEEVRFGLVAGGENLMNKTRLLLGQKGSSEVNHQWALHVDQGNRASVARELLAKETDQKWQIWLRVYGLHERKTELAREYGYRDGGSILQIIKRLHQKALVDPAIQNKKLDYERRLSGVVG